MKTKFFWGITILLSMVMLLGCSNEVFLEQEQSKVQNSELIKEYSTLISQNKYGLLIQIIDQQETLPNWRNLSQDELESVMKLVADEFVKLGGTNNLNKMPNWSSKDDYDLNLATSLGVNALVKKYLNKQVNQASSGEILNVIDNAPTQEFDALIRSFAKRENVKALIDRRGKPSYSIPQAGTRSLETRNSCFDHKYNLRTTIGGVGNFPCIRGAGEIN
jgi:lipoprotein